MKLRTFSQGGGDFGLRSHHEFEVPKEYDEPSGDDTEPLTVEGQVALTIVIQLDNYPQEGKSVLEPRNDEWFQARSLMLRLWPNSRLASRSVGPRS